MKKSDEITRITLAMGLVALSLSALIVHSVLDIKAVARTTMSRLPASLTRGVMEEPTKPAPTLTKLDVECSQIENDLSLEVESKLLQFNFKNCKDKRPRELINLTNGYQATLFKNSEGSISDLVALKAGINEIHVRLEKSPVTYSFKVNAKL